MKKAVFIFNFICMFTTSVFSQSGHYWTQQYGTRSMLLSGSIIGGVEDLGAVYYNPARLGFVENSSFLLSADVYEWSRLQFEKAFDDDINFKKTKFDGVPSLAAGSFKIGILPKHNFAYAILSRHRANLRFNYRDEIVGDVIIDWPGDEIFEGEVGLNSNVREDWFGGSWSHALNEKVSIGASGFFVVKKSDKGNQTNFRALNNGTDVAIYGFNRNFNFNTYSLIWKIAAAFKLNKVDLGLTVTTPGIFLKGKSSYNYQFYFSGIEGVTNSEDVFANSYQNGLNTKIKSPLAIGAGSTFSLNNIKLHLSAEYYNNIPSYTIFKANDHTMQSKPDSVISFQLLDEYKSVVNAGIGVEWEVSEKVSAYASMSTDFSAVVNKTTDFFENKSKINNNTLKADFYHFGSGVVLKLKGADITLGATRTGAKQDIPRPISFPEEGGNTASIFDHNQTAKLIWTRWRFVFSFSVPFLKEYADEKLKKNFTNNP